MKKQLYITTLIALLLTGCSEFLNQEPSEQRSINEQFSTRELVDQAVNGMYYEIEDLISAKYFIYADLLGGNITFTPSEYDHVLEVPVARNIDQAYQFNDLKESSDYKSFYETAYDIINASNIILERVPKTDFIDETEKNQILAEALTGRAFIHYLVSLLYAQNYNYTPDASHLGIVYNKRTLIAGVDYPSRETMADTYQFIQDDLDRALNLFTDKQALSYGVDYSYFNEITASALYAKIALQMNDWEKAISYSDWVINNSQVQLIEHENYLAEWEKPEEPVSEIILEFTAPRESDGNKVSSSVASEHYRFTSTSDYNEFVASQDLLDLYSSADIRGELYQMEYLKTSVNNVIVESPYFFIKKFQDDPGTTFIRLSELYLIRAEARARLNRELDIALADLNSIRTRAGISVLSNTANLLEEIFLERRRELAFEGNLFFDIARYKKDVVREKDCLSSVCNLSYPSDYYVLPIPASSEYLNENMKQNEGY